ncbi:MAG: DNA recombination protein RmuC, partial [Victivallaceae bacterium]|nr:DNA recombination protein RmuC [Victivallaceae bacterium]
METIYPAIALIFGLFWGLLISYFVSRERNRQLVKLETNIAERDKNILLLTEQVANSRTRLEEQNKQNEERRNEFAEAKKRMTVEFENLANKILEDKSKRFTDQNKSNLDELLKPMHTQLGDFRKRVDQIHHEDSKARSSLHGQIEQLNTLNQQMNTEAKNLTRALKGDNKVQGNWGEMILEKVLEQSGLRKGNEYEVQRAFRDSENSLLKPDVIVHLPEEKDIVIDSKVSLIHYNEYVNSEDTTEQKKALEAHVHSVRKHINDLGSKDYSSLKGLRSLDFILMFMPIDAAFMAAFQADEKLFNTAFEKKIVVVTPTTLLATLRTIENIWRYERQNENSRQIADKAGTIYDKLRGFLEDFEKIGKQLDTVDKTYADAMNKLTRGKGNLIR